MLTVGLQHRRYAVNKHSILNQESTNLYKKNRKLTYLVNMARADSTGVNILLAISSVTNSGQFCRKLCIAERAPALPSNVTCPNKPSNNKESK